MNEIILRGLYENNLKNIDLTLPKGKIICFTGVSGSGKSSVVFDTIAVEAKRQMNETYPAFVRNRMPKHERPHFESIKGLSPAVVVDQSSVGSNARSTVGTVSELYTGLRLLFSRIGQPYGGSASFFSFNDPNGMCPACSGMGFIYDIDIDSILNVEKSLREGAIEDSTFRVGSWYLRQYEKSGLFDFDKKLRDFTHEERNLLLYGNRSGEGAPENAHVEGLLTTYRKRYLTRDIDDIIETQREKARRLVSKKNCPLCGGKKLNRVALSTWINGYNIDDMCRMELPKLRKVLLEIDDERVRGLAESIAAGLTRLIDIGLPYLNLGRETSTLSGGEAQRLKLVKYLGSSLTDMMYIFDEPSTGMHPRDVFRMNGLLKKLRDDGNTVLVVEHDPDVIRIADVVVDIGPQAGRNGGQVMFRGSYDALLKAPTLTGRALSENLAIKAAPRKPTGFLPIRSAKLHNLKNVDADIPTGVICVVTGVAGSGKSSLISGVFAAQYSDIAVKIDQSPITATGRSTPASYMGFLDSIRNLFAEENKVDSGYFSFNSLGACPGCSGKGVVVTELVYMDPITTVCEKCGGSRFSRKALSYTYRGRSIIDVLNMTVNEALEFFTDRKILKSLKALKEVGLAYLTLGQPLSTLSGGERQRIKLAKSIGKKGSVYILDEPTTGLHSSDVKKLMELFDGLVKQGSSVIIIEHNTDVMKQADYIIDVGPDGGRNGGEIVFAGTPREMIELSDSITAHCLRAAVEGRELTGEEQAALAKVMDDNTEEETGLKLEPIGRINADTVELDTKYAPALEGLDGFSHVQVLWWFDGCDNEHDRSMTVIDKPYVRGPEKMGAFATRSPERPNPIAVTTAQITFIDKERGLLGLGYIDALDGTPVLDIKPYTPSIDRADSAEVPQWCRHWPKNLETSGDFDWEKEFNF